MLQPWYKCYDWNVNKIPGPEPKNSINPRWQINLVTIQSNKQHNNNLIRHVKWNEGNNVFPYIKTAKIISKGFTIDKSSVKWSGCSHMERATIRALPLHCAAKCPYCHERSEEVILLRGGMYWLYKRLVLLDNKA